MDKLKSFVPAADEVHRLQSQKGDPELELFQMVAEKGHYGGNGPNTTRQGIYAFSPSGVFLGSRNTHSVDELKRMLDKALERYEQLSREQRLRTSDPAADVSKLKRWERLYPSDGLVLRIFSRDLPREEEPDDWRADAWNQDFAWFKSDELSSLVPGRLEKGASAEWPVEIVNRLARTAFLDVVRGQTPPFAPEDVKVGKISSRIVSVSNGMAHVELSGTVEMSAAGWWGVANFKDIDKPQKRIREIKLRLFGSATYDSGSARFKDFQMVALGTRAGGTQFNGRWDDVDAGPIGFALVLAGDSPADKVAPSSIWSYGWR